MKILHLSTQDTGGGAFLGSYWLHQALRQEGVDSQMLVALRYTDDATVHLPAIQPISKLINRWCKWRDKVALRPYQNRPKTAKFTAAMASANLKNAIRRVDPDIVHLHWVNRGFVRPEDLRKWRRPIVWTMRDMWPFSGGCHFSQDCDHYQDRCGRCPELASQSEDDLSRIVWQRKQQAWHNLPIHFVALSSWLAGCARASSLCAEHPVSVIPNAIDSQQFAPQPKQEARLRFNLPLDKKIILFGALHLQEERKGYDYFVEALRCMAGQPGAGGMHVVTFGRGDAEKVAATQMESTHLGFFSDNRDLVAIYSAADVMVVPSTQESFGKTAAEALACQTPVVCFDSTGLKDIVEHQQCGYRAECYSSKDLANGIGWVLADDERRTKLAERGRAKVITEFSMSGVAEQYKALYTKMLQM